MLGKLVSKFRKHTLQEDVNLGGSNSGVLPASDIVQPIRRSARISALYSDNGLTLHDSGTESDDDELERLDSMSNASLGLQKADIMGSSPPNLTSSPPLISEIDTNSWDSTGCESGIVIRDRSEEPSESSRDFAIEQTVQGSGSLISLDDLNRGDVVKTAGGHSTSETRNTEPGAFRPVTRRRSNQQENQGTIGEKRRYDNLTPKPRFGSENGNQQSPIASRLRSFNNGNNGSESSRETLIAARRQPVKLIIHNPSGVRRVSQPLPAEARKNTSEALSESPPYHPLKRGRLNASGRPCLDFEKMRERMVMNRSGGRGSQEFDGATGEHEVENRKERASTTPTSGGRRCQQHHQMRCNHADCVFRPVEVDESCAVRSTVNDM